MKNNMTYEQKLDLCGRYVFLDGVPAKISGAKNQFATVSNGKVAVEFAWSTVARIVAVNRGLFAS